METSKIHKKGVSCPGEAWSQGYIISETIFFKKEKWKG